jgi:leucyl-tRNA synthetase
MANGDVLVMCDRAARNLAYQEHTAEPGVSVKLLSFKGSALIGCAVRSPLAVLEKIYCLPMLTILMNKGTGVVTSVPSDSPADFMALSDLKSKPPMREKFGVKDEWVLPFDVVPCVRVEEFGDACAPAVCERLKIVSQNDKAKLEEAKHLTYLKGFTDGIMLLGAFAGKPVKEVKPLIKDAMLASGDALVYSEPEKPVTSRSGDDCVVALTDQWYLEYGEERWRERAEKCLGNMHTYHDEARRAFEHTLGWLRQWACSRSFGLGTRVPWDPEFLIESLSDSTVYMAYYAVSHLLQARDMYGKERPSVDPSQMTDDVWDAIFLGKDLDPASASARTFPKDLLDEMIAEFNFWYPFDLRVSGKDLIQNHLSFAIYNHVAIWEADETKWPRGFRTNGHLLLNNEKMSKSTGNFKTLKQSVEEYSSDAMRFALADAGDTIEDANFVDDTANAAILRLTKELVWIEEILAHASNPERCRVGDASSFADRVFADAMNVAIEETRNNYENMMFRDALKSGYYDLQSARDNYRVMCGGDANMHSDLAVRYVEVSTLLLTPFCPHTCEHIWGELLKKSGTVTKAGFPVGDAPDAVLAAAAKYLHETCGSVRKGIAKATAPAKKKPAAGQPVPAPKICRSADVFVSDSFVGWRKTCLGILRETFDANAAPGSRFPPMSEILDLVKVSELSRQADFKNVMKAVMPFVKFKVVEAQTMGAGALTERLAFDERAVLLENVEHIRKVCDLDEVRILSADDESDARTAAEKDGQKVDQATPGDPTWHYKVTEDLAAKVDAMEIAK